MRVFSVEMLVKEEGAAVVEAALKRLKSETAAVAAEMKVTTDAIRKASADLKGHAAVIAGYTKTVTPIIDVNAKIAASVAASQQAVKNASDQLAKSAGTAGSGLQTLGTNADISGSRAAKAAIGFAAVGQSIARTGSLTADAGTRIVEAGANIATMFGPKGLAVAAILSFVAFAISKFNEAGNEAQKMREKFEDELKNIANAGDLTGAKDRLRDIMYGVGEGAIDATVDIKDGMIAIQREIRRIEGLPFGEFTAQRGELRRLRGELAAAATQYSDLQELIFNPRVAARPSTAPSPITVTARGPQSAAGTARQEEQAAAAFRAFDEAYYREAEKSFNQRYDAIEKLDEDFNKGLADMMAQHAKDSAEAFATQFEQEQQRIADSTGAVLGNAISTGIEGGLTSGLQMALSGGSLQDSFKAMGQAITQSLASAMVKVALAAIKFGTLLENIKKFMMKHPALAVASAVAMLALARSMGGGASGADMVGTGGAGGLTYSAASSAAPTQQIIFGATSATTAAGMTPRSATNVTIIGPNDPSAQRAMQELMAKADSRGRLG